MGMCHLRTRKHKSRRRKGVKKYRKQRRHRK